MKMELHEDSLFEIINRDVKTLLAEIEEMVVPEQERRESAEIAKNNEYFIEILDTLLENPSTVEELKQ
jgi:hypothetical protein